MTKRHDFEIGAIAYVIIAAIVIAGGLYWYSRYTASHQPQAPGLTKEAKEYVRYLKLSDVSLKATESYVKQLVIEVQGKITNTGDKTVEFVDVYCVFYDAYGQLVRRERVPIVSARTGVLKPSETKPFRLPFDDVPDSWNHQMPQLVIAGMRFS
ncbi:MAG TPA: DUF3426 domain-containing protein [Bryobacteraceae bacterium]|nr:DUF3426 domain-containing protein [Bryobacteraceae bacterium]